MKTGGGGMDEGRLCKSVQGRRGEGRVCKVQMMGFLLQK